MIRSFFQALAGPTVIVAALLVAPPAPAEPQTDVAFVEGIADLPMMPGLALTAEPAVLFDKPAGRIIEALAQGPFTIEAVRRYYGTTLPQLGWQAVAADRFIRADEMLIIGYGAATQGLLVRFLLSPQ